MKGIVLAGKAGTRLHRDRPAFEATLGDVSDFGIRRADELG
ncbi:MAG: hypothetical protein ACM31C_05340 [Acidobacteriota bacterium]